MLGIALRSRAVVLLLAATLMVLATGAGTTSAADPAPPTKPLVEPTTIDVTPYVQAISGYEYPDCPAQAVWAVYLGGGLGTWTLYIDYGNNQSIKWYDITQSSFLHGQVFEGCASRTFVQSWSAASAGGTDSVQTYVNYN